MLLTPVEGTSIDILKSKHYEVLCKINVRINQFRKKEVFPIIYSFYFVFNY
jgi:hypothetical protein